LISVGIIGMRLILKDCPGAAGCGGMGMLETGIELVVNNAMIFWGG
jgi:hypothetical protein